jgi:transcriptional regulator with XRE-family HTH domain
MISEDSFYTDIVSQKIRLLRLERKLTQEQLADALGIKKQTISSYEYKKRAPNYDILLRISKFFQVSTDYLLGISEYRNPSVAQDIADALLFHHENSKQNTQILEGMRDLQYFFEMEHEKIIKIKADTDEASLEELESRFFMISHISREMFDKVVSQLKELYDKELRSIREAIGSVERERREWEDGQYRMDADRP